MMEHDRTQLPARLQPEPSGNSIFIKAGREEACWKDERTAPTDMRPIMTKI
ncbi:hypothetical protein DSECCO2_627890 [anaerobic digester metagenome]